MVALQMVATLDSKYVDFMSGVNPNCGIPFGNHPF